MPKVDLIATKDFTYSTRRLTAGDAFQARNRDDAKILIELLGKARLGRPPAIVAPPPPKVAKRVIASVQHVPTIKEVLKAKVANPRKRRAKARK